MDFFPDAMRHTFDLEGGFTGKDGLPGDPGGPTNMGVTLDTLRRALGVDQDGDGWADGDFNHDGAIDWRDVAQLPREVAAERIYRPRFWAGPGLDRIPHRLVAMKAFDLGVHAGPRAAVRILQAATNDCRASLSTLKQDGQLGPMTLAALGRCQEERLLRAFAARQSEFYLRCIELDPQKAGFKRNWLCRARWPFTPNGGLIA